MRQLQRLQIGVGRNELDSLHAGLDHAVHGIAAAAAHADDLDLGIVARIFVELDADAVFRHA